MRLLLVFILTAWGQLNLWNCSAAAETFPRVVFVSPGKHGETFWELVAEAMRAAAEQLDIELEILWSERDKLELRRLGLEVAARAVKPDYLVLANIEDAVHPILEAAEREGIATLFIVSSTTQAELTKAASSNGGKVASLGAVEPDMREAGQRMAQRLVEAARRAKLQSADGKIHVLALPGDEISPTSLSRTGGALDVFLGEPDIVVDRTLYSNWTASGGEVLTSRYLDFARQRGLKPAIIWAANDSTAIGAIKAIKAKGLRPNHDSIVAGLDWSPEAVELIEQGDLLLSDGGHFLSGGVALALLKSHANGCGPLTSGTPRFVPFSTAPVDAMTTPFILELLKKRRFDRIDFRRLASARGACRGPTTFGAETLVRRATGPLE